jgi:hypothetical protein
MKVSADGRKAGLRYSTVTSSSPERPRIPHSRSYQVTPEGLSIARFLTRVTQRFLIPGLGQLTGTGPPGSARQTAPTRPRSPASPSRHLSSPDHPQSRRPTRAQPQESHTPQLDSKFRIPAGKDNLPSGPVAMTGVPAIRRAISVALPPGPNPLRSHRVARFSVPTRSRAEMMADDGLASPRYCPCWLPRDL